MRREPNRSSYRVALEGDHGRAYNEEAFRHFLAMEQKRSERSGRPFSLLLLDLRNQPGGIAGFDAIIAQKLFSGLWVCLRETDFVGWFREDRVAGAVLTQLSAGAQPDMSRMIALRISGFLCDSLPPDIARSLRVRAYQLSPKVKR